MKKLLVMLMLLAPLFAGCTNIETRITLNNKSAMVVSSLTYNGNLSDKADANAQLITDKYADYLNSDYNVTTAYGSKFSTITGTKKIDNLYKKDIDLSSLGLKSNLKSGKFVEINKNFLVTSYNVNATFDYPAIAASIQTQQEDAIKEQSIALEPEYLQKYGDKEDILQDDIGKSDFAANIDESVRRLAVNKDDEPINPAKSEAKDEDVNLSFSIELPSFAYYNNADSTDGNIYTWKIRKNVPTEIKLQYVKYSGFAIFSIVFIGMLLLIYLAYRIIRHENHKRVGSNN